MARNQTVIDAPPQQVWAVLADPDSYGHWVVGSQRIRRTEGRWPQPGARFHHRVGIGPLTIPDHTEVVEMVPERRLVLSAKARPLGVARVELELEPAPGGRTHLTMVETPEGGWRKLIPPPLVDPLIRLRNVESLRRLRALAVRR